jgi:hypothetical protein
MTSNIYICQHGELRSLLIKVISTSFHLDSKLLPNQITRSLDPLISDFRKDLWFLIETPYVDRIYRDSYYLYYASKYGRYSRDCIKVSIFKANIEATDFRSSDSDQKLEKNYLGFIIIRPTEPDFLGRNVISPMAFEKPPFEYCAVSVNSTANGLKLQVQGFPHSSQDSETYSCAETTIWALMEYFGTKYPDYRPVKPSQIHALLKNLVFERQIPSRGLTIYQISYVLKELGFGCRIYSSSEYGNDFFKILNCYIESGIPLAVGMDDFYEPVSNNIGHAVLVIGKKKVDPIAYASLSPNVGLTAIQSSTAKKFFIELFDFDDLPKEYVVIDDNRPPYQIVPANNPTVHYQDARWGNVKIKNFVVPLYPKIYLEAVEAKNFVREFLIFGPVPLEKNQKVFLRFYLTSSRSFKHSLLKSNVVSPLKDIIIEKPMPKFVWIAELASEDLVFSDQRNGLVVVDATEPNIADNKPLIVAAYQGEVVFFDGENDVLTKLSLPLPPFNLFLNNLIQSFYV